MVFFNDELFDDVFCFCDDFVFYFYCFEYEYVLVDSDWFVFGGEYFDYLFWYYCFDVLCVVCVRIVGVG